MRRNGASHKYRGTNSISRAPEYAARGGLSALQTYHASLALSHTGLRGPEAVAGECGGTARRGAVRHQRDLPQCRGRFAEGGADQAASANPTPDFDLAQPRDSDGKWSALGAGAKSASDPNARAAGKPSGSDVIAATSFEEFASAVQSQPLGAAGHAPDGTSIEFIQQTCAAYISANCRASILRVFPGRYLDQPMIASCLMPRMGSSSRKPPRN